MTEATFSRRLQVSEAFAAKPRSTAASAIAWVDLPSANPDLVRSERRAAREVEKLRLVVLALGDRVGEIDSDRSERRGPQKAAADRATNGLLVVDGQTARLRQDDRPVGRAIVVAKQRIETLAAVEPGQGAGIRKERSFKAYFARQPKQRKLDFRGPAEVRRAAEPIGRDVVRVG